MCPGFWAWRCQRVGGTDMYLPLADIHVSAYLLLLIGFCVGTLGGFFGIGGGFIVTPALIILGFKPVYAVGTDLAQIMGNSLIATIRHGKMGNVDVKLGVLMFLGTAVGVEIGKLSLMFLEELGYSLTVISVVYVLLLGGIGGYMAYDYMRFIRGRTRNRNVAESVGSTLSKKIQAVHLPPMVSLKKSGIKSVSLWVILFVGFITGFLAGFLGVGGGFIRMPALIYSIGVPTTVAIGTDLFEIIFSSAVGAFTYALSGTVEIKAAVIMLLGGAIGAQLGTLATKYIKGMEIRLFFAVVMILAGFSMLLKQLSVWYDLPFLSSLALYILFGSATVMSLIVIGGLVMGIISERERMKVLEEEAL